jgi:hypothetical protein
MAVASPRRPKTAHWRRGALVDMAAERDGLAWSLLNREQEEADAAFEARQFAAPDFIPDDGFDFRDAADSTCISFASPSIGERDPNAELHDRYQGTVYDRGGE